jgi:hypothetical protein
MICAICLEEINEKNNCTTLCNHKFCLSCILKSLKYKNSCPICREIIIIENTENIDEIIEDIIEEESFNEPTEFISNESITTIRYFLRSIYIYQLSHNIIFGLSYGFGVGSGLISSMLIFYKIFKN